MVGYSDSAHRRRSWPCAAQGPAPAGDEVNDRALANAWAVGFRLQQPLELAILQTQSLNARNTTRLGKHYAVSRDPRDLQAAWGCFASARLICRRTGSSASEAKRRQLSGSWATSGWDSSAPIEVLTRGVSIERYSAWYNCPSRSTAPFSSDERRTVIEPLL